MPTQGPSGGTAAANDGTVGSSNWANPTDALTDNSFYASFDETLSLDSVTFYLKITGFGFSLPSNAIVTGIVAGFKRVTTLDTLPLDNSIKFFKGGAVHGNELSTSAGWSSTETTVNFGSSTNLSGGTYTPADINASDFGVGISVMDPSTGGWIAKVNYVTITVYYTVNGAPQMCMLGVGI